jgi:hypothetical protein
MRLFSWRRQISTQREPHKPPSSSRELYGTVVLRLELPLETEAKMPRPATPSIRQTEPAAESHHEPTIAVVGQAPFDQMLLDDFRVGAIRAVFVFVFLLGLAMAFLSGF